MATSIADLRQRAKMPVQSKGGGKTLADFFETNKASIAAALPRHLTADRIMKVALHAVRTTPQLQKCTVESLFGAVVQCSTLGLEPNSVLGHAYLIPFNNRREGTTEVQIVVGYKGLIDLARRSGQIQSIRAHAVYSNDEFDLRLGTDAGITHKPHMDGDRGSILGFYAVATLKDGGEQFEFMTRYEVDLIRDGSQGYRSAKRYNKDHPWISHYEAMGRKTVIRRLAKYLPLSVEMATATTLDGMAEGGQSQGLSTVLDGEYSLVDGSEDAPPPADEEPAQAEPVSEQAPEYPAPFEDPETGDKTWTDANGEFFDPEKHGWSKENEQPAVNKDGTFRAKRGTGQTLDLE